MLNFPGMTPFLPHPFLFSSIPPGACAPHPVASPICAFCSHSQVGEHSPFPSLTCLLFVVHVSCGDLVEVEGLCLAGGWGWEERLFFFWVGGEGAEHFTTFQDIWRRHCKLPPPVIQTYSLTWASMGWEGEAVAAGRRHGGRSSIPSLLSPFSPLFDRPCACATTFVGETFPGAACGCFHSKCQCDGNQQC